MSEREHVITFKEYQRRAHATSGRKNRIHMLTMAALGMCGESGEFADLVKKELFHGHERTTGKMIEELGDVLWYVSEACTGLGITLEAVALTNIVKLEARYPDGFSSERSINREK